MDKLKAKEESNQILEKISEPSKLPTTENLKKYKNKDLDTNKFLVNYLAGKEIYSEKNLTKEDAISLNNLVNLGLVIIYHASNNELIISLTKFGSKCLQFIKKQYNKNKKHIKKNNFEINISFIILVICIMFAILFYVMSFSIITWIFIIFSIFEELYLMIVAVFSSKHYIKMDQIKDFTHFTESNYIKLINKYIPRHQRNIYKKYLLKINNKISDDN